MNRCGFFYALPVAMMGLGSHGDLGVSSYPSMQAWPLSPLHPLPPPFSAACDGSGWSLPALPPPPSPSRFPSSSFSAACDGAGRILPPAGGAAGAGHHQGLWGDLRMYGGGSRGVGGVGGVRGELGTIRDCGEIFKCMQADLEVWEGGRGGAPSGHAHIEPSPSTPILTPSSLPCSSWGITTEWHSSMLWPPPPLLQLPPRAFLRPSQPRLAPHTSPSCARAMHC